MSRRESRFQGTLDPSAFSVSSCVNALYESPGAAKTDIEPITNNIMTTKTIEIIFFISFTPFNHLVFFIITSNARDNHNSKTWSVGKWQLCM